MQAICTTHNCGLDCYLLAEYTSPDPNYIWGYDKRNFSLLPGIDESELVNEKEEVYA